MARGRAEFGTGIEKLKASFFDREKVLKAMDRAVAKQMGWFGGYVRRVAQNSLKPSDKFSAPGDPPFTHVTYLRKHQGRHRTKLTKPKRKN